MEVEEMGCLKLEDYVVGSLPTLLYIPDFITESEQTQLLHHIYEVPSSKWKSLKNRRLQNWGGVVHEKGLLPQDLPSWLTKFTQRICERTGLFPSPINHVLINEYLPDQGIMVVNAVKVESLQKHPSSISAANDDSNDNVREEGLLHRRGTRVSLTCRLVSKVYRNLFKF